MIKNFNEQTSLSYGYKQMRSFKKGLATVVKTQGKNTKVG